MNTTRKGFIGQLIAICATPSIVISTKPRRWFCVRSNRSSTTYLNFGKEEIGIEPGESVEVSQFQLDSLHNNAVYIALANEAWLVEYEMDGGRNTGPTGWMHEHLKKEFFLQGLSTDMWMRALGYTPTKEELEREVELEFKTGRRPNISKRMERILPSRIFV